MNNFPLLQESTSIVTGEYSVLNDEQYFQISNAHEMDEFFVSVVSAFDHWMFVSSRGALTAGRGNPQASLFPYYCADKIVDCAEATGPKTIFRVDTPEGQRVWEPFARIPDRSFETTQSLYKNIAGNRIVFEETNQTLGLTFRYSWSFGNRFGFIRKCYLMNHLESTQTISMIDGIENILPAKVDPTFQLRFSNLADAYKKSELLQDSNLAIYYLSSIPTDRAEPNEGLRANVVWSTGLKGSEVLVCSRQVEKFRQGRGVESEFDVRGVRGAYLRHAQVEIPGGQSIDWRLVAGLEYDQTDVIDLNHWLLNSTDIEGELDADMADGDEQLQRLVAASDGIQLGSQQRKTHRHQSNVLFNIMRGGIPVAGYLIPKSDFIGHVRSFSKQTYDRNRKFLDSLPEFVENQELNGQIMAQHDDSLLRIGLEYLPLTFSRRHGDPTRPWNEFSINVAGEDGERLLNYQGNWRDIFQNWEALAISYPQFALKMVFRFLNASTADGYNPYRITKNGFEWERLDPTDPWSNIGYWGDHQIVYLLRLLERARQFFPSEMNQWLGRNCFSYANVPYRIGDYEQILKNPQDTISFDSALDELITQRVSDLGEDGKLLRNSLGETLHVSMLEKLIVPSMVKMSNFVPEGGIWLNTQRPEWNDANNALVGTGLSVVTSCDLRKYFVFLKDWLEEGKQSEFSVSDLVMRAIQSQVQSLSDHAVWIESGFDDVRRRALVDELSQSGSDYRSSLYQNGLPENKSTVSNQELIAYFEICIRYLDQTIRTNRRSDGLYHSYNLLELEPGVAKIGRLFEMLEGQVAVLNSGLLSASEALDVLDALRSSRMFRADQQSYMLYPDRDLPRFTEKNQIPEATLKQSSLLLQLIKFNDCSIVRVDTHGGFHFNGDIRNSAGLAAKLEDLRTDSRFASLIDSDRDAICQLFEQTFNHKTFTGRSGTFFAYEGLGSIYWHMVSKLRLAVVDYLIRSNTAGVDSESEAQIASRLKKHFEEISFGIGATKSPDEYGAIPTDPYSHTPKHAGAQQPGMTGQVKEDILARYAELGVRINNGILSFDPALFNRSELTTSRAIYRYLSVDGTWTDIELNVGEFAFTICQVPIIFQNSGQTKFSVQLADGLTERDELSLTGDESNQLFSRDSSIKKIEVKFPF